MALRRVDLAIFERWASRGAGSVRASWLVRADRLDFSSRPYKLATTKITTGRRMTDLSEPKENKRRPDLYIALVGAAGTDLQPVKTQLKAHLASFDYAYQDVKVSQLIAEFCDIDTRGMEEDQRVRALMDGGDRIRADHHGGDGVVSLMVNYIQSFREKDEEPSTGLLGSTAFVIDSLKNPEEIKTLNSIYGRNFYTVSVYATAGEREAKLSNRIAETCNTNTRDEHKKRAQNVIKEDERRDTTPLSQDVQGTFPRADFFVKCGEGVETQIKRFIDLVFGEPFTTPTFDEYAMFMAKAASLRSNDLSRQVGAAIFSKDNVLISSGYNEVPYPGGGAWYEGRAGADNRDHKVEYDPNSAEISNIFRELVNAFRKANLLSSDAGAQDDDALVEGLLHGQWRSLTVDARVRNLIEFGRVVHAEMHALA